jgi:hypothetical protein
MAYPRSSLRHSTTRRKLLGNADPVTLDPGLERLLGQVGSIKTEDELFKWRISVLGRYEAFVQHEGIEVARRADIRLLEKLKEFENTLQAVQHAVDDGGIRSDYVNVRGNNVLVQLNKQAEESEENIIHPVVLRENSTQDTHTFSFLSSHFSDVCNFAILTLQSGTREESGLQ